MRGNYLCGPLARFNLHFDKLSAAAREAARRANIAPPCHNPFKSILVRGVETAWALEEAIALIEAYDASGQPFAAAPMRPSIGYGVSEAPRGMLYHRYRLDDAGLIRDAKIVPPTSQNLALDRRRPDVPGAADDRDDGVRRDSAGGAGGAQLRPVHLVRHAFPQGHAGKGIGSLGGADHRRGTAMGR